MAYPYHERQERHATFLHPNGLPNDPEPYITRFGLVLPGIRTSEIEFEALREYIINPQAELFKHHDLLPTLKQLGRISLNSATGCWIVPVKDTYCWDDDDCYYLEKIIERYPVMQVNGAPEDGNRAHRVMYSIMRGDIPAGLVLDHLCENKRCCYHRHLQAVSNAENLRRIQEARNRNPGQTFFLF